MMLLMKHISVRRISRTAYMSVKGRSNSDNSETMMKTMKKLDGFKKGEKHGALERVLHNRQ